jgi:pimeloyl-ACP methyl ester carboxylesterase
MLPDADAASAAALLAQGSLVKLPQVGHLIHWLAPEATARLVCGFLESV